MKNFLKKIYWGLASIIYRCRCLRLHIKYHKGVKIKRGVNIDRKTKVILSEDCTISHHVSFWGGGVIKLGKNSHIGSYSSIYACKEAGVEFGNDVNCARNLFIIDSNHNFEDKDQLIMKQGMSSQKVIIGNNIWIGANVTLVKGAEIGDGCVIGACSLVNKKFSENCVIGGVPAKIIKMR